MLAITLCLIFGSVILISFALDRPLHLQLERYRSLYLQNTSHALNRVFAQASPGLLLHISLGLALLFSIAIFILSDHLWMATGGGIFGFFTPPLTLKVIARRRRQKLRAQIVDGLQTIANALRAGFSLIQALALVSRQISPPLSQEFALVVREHKIGVPLEEALGHLCERSQDEDIVLAVTAVLISREVGGNLAETLGRIAATVRERSRIQGKVHALTAQGRLQAMVMGTLPFLVGLALHHLDPNLIEPLFTHPLGRTVLGITFFLEAAGIMLMRSLSRVTY